MATAPVDFYERLEKHRQKTIAAAFGAPRGHDPERIARIRRGMMDREIRRAAADPSTTRLRHARLQQRLTLRELEARSGVARNTILAAERRKARTQAGTLERLATALGVPVSCIG